MRHRFVYTGAIIFLACIPGCTASVSTNGGTTGCAIDDTVSCYPGGSGYSCSGSSNPQGTGRVCSTNNAGEWCCYASTTCNPDSSVTGCVSGSYGYSCAVGAGAPDTTDPSLICSIPTATNGLDEYCCAASTIASGATCTQDQSVQGCQPGSYGFSCTGAETPATDFSGITCSLGTPSSSATLYCCTYNNSTQPLVTCNQTYQIPANGGTCGTDCDACLQTYECTALYKACDSTCQSEVQAMEACMQNADDANGGALPSGAETNCSNNNLGGTNTAAYALWWEVIRVSLDCSIPCCAAL
jgi:hypothetical protein